VSTLRTFIAVKLSENIIAELRHLQGHLRDQLAPGSVRWVRPEIIHLTLKFLGDTPLAQVEEVKVALGAAAEAAHPFEFTVGGLGCFPNTRRPRVIWVGLQEHTGALMHLRNLVENHVAPVGFPTEKRRFNPHLTLGRIHRRASKSEVREIGQLVASSAIGTLGEVAVTSVSYLKSDLRPSGAVHATLLDVSLGPAELSSDAKGALTA
jgi:2'-5' RNA ligase